MGEKTEKPTQKKLRDARRKGQVAKAQDFPAAFTFIVSIAATLAMMPTLYNHLGKLLEACLKLISEENLPAVIAAIFYQSCFIILLCSMPILLITAFVGMLATFVVTGPVWAPEVFKFDIKKFNPVENLKSKFKMKTLIELLKSLFKIFVASYIVYKVVLNALPEITQTITLPVLPACMVFYEFLKEVIIKIGIFFLAVALFDLMFQKFTFEKEMRMEKFEIKQEYKDTEGDPMIKSRRRQIAQEIAYQEGPAAAAGKAKAVVTNPTHIAIALDYDKEMDPCPFVIAMGQGPLAEQIIAIATRHNVPIIRNIPLAHKLWEDAKLYEYVPEETYEPVAEVLRWVASLQPGTETPEEPLIQV
jgi:type III secretion protein U